MPCDALCQTSMRWCVKSCDGEPLATAADLVAPWLLESDPVATAPGTDKSRSSKLIVRWMTVSGLATSSRSRSIDCASKTSTVGLTDVRRVLKKKSEPSSSAATITVAVAGFNHNAELVMSCNNRSSKRRGDREIRGRGESPSANALIGLV